MIKVLKNGYKQTDIGIIPEDWDVDYIKNICKIKTGDKNTQDSVESGIFPFFVRSQTIEKINSYSFDGEAILTAGDGGAGKIFHYINGKFDFHQRVYKLSNFKESVDGYYFYKYFSHNFYYRIMSMTAKSTVDSVRLDMINNMQIPIPKIEEQKNIAEALSDIDQYIRSLEQLSIKKRDMKTGVMQMLLTGRKRLPGFSSDWEKGYIGDCLEICHGKSQKEVENDNGVNPILATGGVIGYTNSYLYNEPSVLIGRKGTINKPQYIDKPFWSVDTLFYSKVVQSNLPKFLYYKFCMIDWMQYNEASGVPSLSAKTIEKIPINYPKTNEQIAITKILSDIDTELDCIEVRLTKAKSLKMGMMQELLTGKTRLFHPNNHEKVPIL